MVVVHFAKQNEEEDSIYTIISNNLTHHFQQFDSSKNLP